MLVLFILSIVLLWSSSGVLTDIFAFAYGFLIAECILSIMLSCAICGIGDQVKLREIQNMHRNEVSTGVVHQGTVIGAPVVHTHIQGSIVPVMASTPVIGITTGTVIAPGQKIGV